MKRDISIQIVRIFSMFMIIACHLVQEHSNNNIVMLAQFFNVGVYIFLFLSGYLYGNKKINNAINWFLNRFIKIMIPIYVFLIVFFAIQIFVGEFELKYVFIYLFNLQYFWGASSGIGHLWFMTAIMLCYLITPFLNKINENNKYYQLIIIVLILSIIICFINSGLSMLLFCVLTYILGYTYRKVEDKLNINTLLSIFSLILAVGVRLISKFIFDGTVLYDVILVSLTQIIIAFNVFYLLRLITNKLNIKENKLINHLDTLSFPLYITHYMFIVGPVRMMNITNIFILNSIIVIFISYVSAILLNLICNLIIIIIKKNSKLNI